MDEGVSTNVQTWGGETGDFPITIGLRQGSNLSSYFFTLILDVITKYIQELAPRCMLFVDDTLILRESNENLNKVGDL